MPSCNNVITGIFSRNFGIEGELLY